MEAEAKVGGVKKARAGKTGAAKRKNASKPRTKKREDTDSPVSTHKKKGLSEEALEMMCSESSELVEHFWARAKRGDIRSAQMLVELAKNETKAKEALKHLPLRSQALAWAAEPQWQDDADGETAENWNGSKEAD